MGTYCSAGHSKVGRLCSRSRFTDFVILNLHACDNSCARSWERIFSLLIVMTSFCYIKFFFPSVDCFGKVDGVSELLYWSLAPDSSRFLHIPLIYWCLCSWLETLSDCAPLQDARYWRARIFFPASLRLLLVVVSSSYHSVRYTVFARGLKNAHMYVALFVQILQQVRENTGAFR